MLHRVPRGGEDLTGYDGPPHLIPSSGTESFDTVVEGVMVLDHPVPGEIHWCDHHGVTCGRWSWRQGHRTRLHDSRTSVLFILDALAPMSYDDLQVASQDLSPASPS